MDGKGRGAAAASLHAAFGKIVAGAVEWSRRLQVLERPGETAPEGFAEGPAGSKSLHLAMRGLSFLSDIATVEETETCHAAAPFLHARFR